MRESKLYPIFNKKIHEADPNCFWYKIPDFALGGKRPFDGILIFQGVPFAIEFKSENGTLEKYQAYQLQNFILAGGEALVFWEGRQTMDEFIEEIKTKANRKEVIS